MLDIKLIRENPERINELLKRRNPELSIDKVLQLMWKEEKFKRKRINYVPKENPNLKRQV